MEAVKLREAIQTLSASLENAIAEVDQIERSDLTRLCKAFILLKENKDMLEGLLEILSRVYTNLNQEVLPDVLEQHEMEKCTIAGKTFGVSVRLNASIPENKRIAGHHWLENVARIPELIVPRTNPKQLSSFITAYFVEHAQFPPEDAVSVHMQRSVSMRKA